MKTIHKFLLELKDWQSISMPKDAEILHLDTQFGQACLWALVDSEAPLQPRNFITRGTGYLIQDGWIKYIGTYKLEEGRAVFHVLEVV